MQSLFDKITQNLSQLALATVGLALIVSNVLLVVENRRVKNSLAQSKKFVTDVGYRFSGLTARTLDGKEESLFFSHDGKQTFLFVFRPSCGYCLQQYPYWQSLIKSVDHEKWRIVAITSEMDTDVIRKHLEDNGLGGLDARTMPADEMAAARLGYTPMTLHVNSDGFVIRVWPGLWTGGFDLTN